MPPPAVSSNLSSNIKHIAVVKGAREVTLAGTADLSYWRDRLKGEGLYPYRGDDGRADVLISAVASKWMGVTFRELSISVFVCENEAGTSPDGVFLVAAFNSSRFFAWCERTMFQTPYRHADIEVQKGPPTSFKLLEGADVVLDAEQPTQTAAASASDVVWDVKIFLPMAATAKPSPGKLFHARLSGHTEIYPFSPTSDVVRFARSPHFPEIECLVDSHFAASEWQIRRWATHARSKTFDRERR